MHEHGSAYFDTDLHVGYAYVTDKPVAKTIAVSDVLLLDLAADGDVVGIEVLSRLHEVPVTKMASDYNWSPATWRAVNTAAKDLENLMRAHPTTGSDGVYRATSSWGKRDLVGA